MQSCEQTISVKSLKVADMKATAVVQNAQDSWLFSPTDVLMDVPQDVVFQRCAQDIVQGVLDGFNGTLLAYGYVFV